MDTSAIDLQLWWIHFISDKKASVDEYLRVFTYCSILYKSIGCTMKLV